MGSRRGKTGSVVGCAAIQRHHVRSVIVEGRDEVNMRFRSWSTRSRTTCGRSKGETRSAWGSAASEQDTHRLWTVEGQAEVSMWFHSYPTTSRTSCDQGRAEVSMRFCSYLTMTRTGCGSQMARGVNNVTRQLLSDITYILWAVEGRDEVNVWFYSYPMGRHTSCRRWKGGTGQYAFCRDLTKSHTSCRQSKGQVRSTGGSADVQ